MTDNIATTIPVEMMQEGRDIGVNLLRKMLSECCTDDEATRSLIILQVAATHVLASIGFNADLTGQVNGQIFLERMFDNIRSEFALLCTEHAEGRLHDAPRKEELKGDPNPDFH